MKRYNVAFNGHLPCDVVEADDGAFVAYADHQAEVERLRETLRVIECESTCEDAAGWARAALAEKE